VAVTSVNSIILDTATSSLTTPTTAKLTLTATSAAGQVLINNATATDAIGSAVTISATGNSAMWSSLPLILNGVTVTNGTFAADTGESTASPITEASGSTVATYGNDTFITQASKVTLGNSGNNFGAITIDTTNANETPAGAGASIKEYSGNNYASVNTGTAGTFSATSEQSIILETGNTGIRAGGKVTLAAPNGSITLTATGKDKKKKI